MARSKLTGLVTRIFSCLDLQKKERYEVRPSKWMTVADPTVAEPSIAIGDYKEVNYRFRCTSCGVDGGIQRVSKHYSRKLG